MKKIITFLSAALVAVSTTFAGEGMWMLNTLQQINGSQMQQLGFKLTPQDIYDINHSSIKDGVVRLGGGFCSGEIVSSEGLMLTNHHCGFDAIQSFSSVEHDYLTNGFWAMTRADELPAEFYVSFLQRIDDVSERVKSELNDKMTEKERQAKISEIGKAIKKEAEISEYITADFKSMFDGNEFYLFVYKNYHDVRLVGAPPSAIGKFGGDTDNWMWPRHTGDFSMFRVYAAPDGEPAHFSKDNVPYKPKWHFPVSLNGVKKGDFAMVMGYPGRTNRFLCSDGVKMALDISQPSTVKVRTELLARMKEDMDQSDAVRIKYASKYASISNYWKYFIGQQRGLKRLHVYDKKVAQEDALNAWINADAGRKERYGEWQQQLRDGYAARTKWEKSATYLNEALFGSEIMDQGFGMLTLMDSLKANPKNTAVIAPMVAQIHGGMEPFFKDYNAATDEKITASMFRMYYNDVDPAQQPAIMNTIATKYKGDFDAWAKAMFSTSILCDSVKLSAFLKKPSYKVLNKDMGMQAALSIRELLPQVRGGIAPSQMLIARGNRLMVAAMREMDPNKMWYPNANSTMRCTYGQVNDYTPGDAMHYDLVTTADGILEKEDNTNEEFVVPQRQHDLLMKRDYGRYADASGELVTCFISENDITGGNSGSPVINGYGELIGIAFDGNWEAMSGDIAYEPELQRTISVDIRYVLWVIDKYAGAGHLVNEMTLVQGPKEEPKAEVVPVVPPVVPVQGTVKPMKQAN